VERKIVRHAVGAAAHESALDAEFHVGQRVVTIDGVAGRIQFVTGSFAPGVSEYQVVLDNGMGGGTYTASQLRPVSDSYHAPSGPHSNLPAGVTAAIEAEAGEIHVASDDYPEMGQILHDRPDPAGLIRMIGSRHQADAYAQGHDARDDDENGGEADTGMYWEAPANQQWRDENLGEPPEPEIQDVPGYGQEQFEQQFGKISTTINGYEVDGHGDAPQHGTTPRAGEPNSYDGESTEGQGDPDEDKPLSGMSDKAGKSATSGMFPGGVSAGDGFGELSFGAAFGQDQSLWDGWNEHAGQEHAPDPHPDHDSDDEDELRYPEEHLQTEARVPWTGHERTELHNWTTGNGAADGDFVPSGNFTGRHPVQPLHEQLDEPAPEVIEQQIQAQGAYDDDRLCAYTHPGECAWPGDHLASTAESTRHSRPRGYSSDIREIDDAERKRHLDKYQTTPTHAMHGYLNGQHLGTLTWQESDDGKAAYVTNLHSSKRRSGLASAMMDDLYSHAHQNGMWINHGQRTNPGAGWWNSYSEPHPHLNVHNTQPDHRVFSGDSWSHYWSPHEVAADMWANNEKDKARKHPEPHFDEYDHEDDPHDEKWTRSKIPLPKAEDDPHSADAKADAMRDMKDNDPYHGWGDMAREHAMQAALRVLSDAGPDFEAEQGWAAPHHAEPRHMRARELGGGSQPGTVRDHPEDTADRVSRTHEVTYREPSDPHKQHAFYSSRTTEAGVRVRTNGPNDFTFHHVPDDAEDPSNSLDEGEPDERPDELDAEQDENGLESGEAPGQPPAEEDTGEDAGLEDDPGEQQPPGNLPAGVQPPTAPSKRPPMVPQSGNMPAETWPLATAPVQERPLPLSQGGKPSPSTKRSNPVKLQLPGAGDGSEVDGEKPGSDDKGPSKEAALAAFTAAAGSEAFRFEFTASWRDVVAKAKRLRQGNRVRITHVSAGLVIGEVGGDHDVYEAGIQRPAGRPQTIQHWACGCPWASYHQDSSYPGRLNGRPCSHVYALQLEASARSMYGRELMQDPSADELGVPHQVVVKSMPPWGAGGWAQTWLAPAASLAVTAARSLVNAGEDPADVELLARTAGIDLTAAANDPWGDNNYAEHPPAKPYGATEPRDPNKNPANTGPLNAPDPADWAEIPDSGLIGPITSESSLPGLDQPAQDVPDTPGGATPYAYQTNTAGPATAMDPGDPNGLSVDAALSPDEMGAGYEQHLIEQHGVHPDYASRHDHEKHLLDHDDVNQIAHRGDELPAGYHPHPYHQTEWEHRQEPGSWPDAGHSHTFTGAEHRELPDPTPGPEVHHHPECICQTCDYNRYHAKHAVQIAMQAGLAELEANAVGEAERLRAGIDGTAGDAQDVPHAFSGNTPYCHACTLSPESGVHHRDGESLHTTPEPALPETTGDLASPDASQYALDPGATGGGPGMSGGDEDLSPSDTSIQTVGEANFGGSDELADESFSVSPQENTAEAGADNIAEQFQATGAARQYMGEGGPPSGDGDIAAAAKAYLAKTADVLPDHEAAALISEGRGTRARNLDLLRLEGTHYEDMEEEVGKRGLNLDDYDDDLVVL
jgi:hypothetical protein